MRTQKNLWMMALVAIIILLSLGHLFAAIPVLERTALVALYNNTNGDSWTTNSGWKTEPLDADGFALPGTEGGWYGVTVVNNHVTKLFLPYNNLNGRLPATLGDLQEMSHLYLYQNQLSGSLPVELGNLLKLNVISIYANNISGTIPASLGNLHSLSWLCLDGNRFTGSIPAELGNLASLIVLYLEKNQLSGQIPPSFINLTSLRENGSLLKWNALYTTDNALRAFLNRKQEFGDWESTQTIAPTNITAEVASPTSVLVSWDPIVYTANTGGYRIYCRTNSGGVYTEVGITPNKTASSMTVSGLTPGKDYYFVVKTQTNPQANNRNTVVSESSAEVCVSLPLDPVKISALPLAAVPGAHIQFINNSGGEVNRFIWEFGDGSREGYRHGNMPGQKVHPEHTYAETGDYTVTLTAFGWERTPPITLNLPNLICIDSDYAPLAVMAGSETYDGYGWSKTIDHDVFTTNSKIMADLPVVECVYNFADSSIRNVNRVRLFADDIYQKNFPGHLTDKFEVWVSVDNVSWTQALVTSLPWEYRGQFASFTFPPVLGRYVKLKLTEPHNPNAEIIQLTEFQVFGAKNEDIPLDKAVLADNAAVTEYKLAQNYPNPFNPRTTITFALPEAADISLQVYNVAGKMVAELVNRRHDAGRHQVIFDAADLSSGIYFYRFTSRGFQHIKRMTYLK